MGIRLDCTQHPPKRGGGEQNQQVKPQIPSPADAAASPSLPGLPQPTWGYPRPPWRSAKIPGCQQGWGNALLCLPCCRDRDIWQLPAGKVSGALWEHDSELPALPDVSLLLIYSARQIFALRRPTLSRRGFVFCFFFFLLAVTASNKPPQCHLGKPDLPAKHFQHPFPRLLQGPVPLPAAIPFVRDGGAGCQNPQAKATTHGAAAGKGHFRPTSSTA